MRLVTLLLCLVLGCYSWPQNSLPRSGRILVDGIPQDSSGQGRAGFRLPLPGDSFDDFAVVVEAGDEGEGRDLPDNLPRDFSGENEAGFRLPLPRDSFDDIAVVVEAGEEGEGRDLPDNFPRDFSGESEAGFRLPLPQDTLEDLAVVVEAALDSETRGRAAGDIPRDFSGEGRAGFRLPLPQDDDIAVVVEAGNDGEGRELSENFPRDFSGETEAGFRLPLPRILTEDDFIVIEAAPESETASRALSDIPRDRSGEGRAGFRLPLPDSNVIVVEAGGRDAPRFLTPDRGLCQVELARSSRCRATIQVFTYSQAIQQCKEELFAGCGNEGQENMFSSLAECEAVCGEGAV